MNAAQIYSLPADAPLRVLYLEDNALDRELLIERLNAEGLVCDYVHASTRAEYETAIDHDRFDLIISDFTLPAYHGMAALAIARERQPHAPFLFVSGTIGEERAVESLKSGATDYVIKENLERLAPAIRRALYEASEHLLRKEAEDALRLSEERFRMVFDSAPIGILNVDPHGLILRTNPALQTMLGYTETQLAGTSINDLTHPEDIETSNAAFAELIIGNRPRIRLEKRCLRRDKTILWVQLTASGVHDRSGRYQHSVTLIEDLTERKQNEEQMRDQAALLDMAADAIVVKDGKGHIIHWNRGAERLYGWTSAEALGQKAAEFLYPDPATYEVITKSFLSHGTWSGELRQLTRSGREVIVSSRGTLMRDERGQPKSVLIINTDVTERRKLEAQFLRAQRMESIGTLASGIAHDLNNILAPISIASQILRMKGLDAEGAELIGRIESSAHRGAEVVKQVLTFARGVEGERVLIQPRHVIREITKIIFETFPKSIEHTSSLGENLWPVMGDATQLHQVFLNLCLNARDAMPNGGILHLSAENFLVEDAPVGMSDAKAGPYVLFQVRDTGTGIPQELIEKIFEPFFTTKELGKGTGLGLSTVLGIVKSHGGSIQVYSEPGRGTAFKIYLPAQPNVDSANVSNTKTPLLRGHGELILVVDDESAIRDVTRTILVRNGYNALIAVDGVDALALFNEQAGKVQLVLTDMMMPRMEGIALIKAIRELQPDIKIIAASGLSQTPGQDDRAAELKTVGVSHFLAKPYTADKLLTAIHELLAPSH